MRREPLSMFERGMRINALFIFMALVSSMALSGYLILWPLIHVATEDFAGVLVDSARIWAELPVERRPEFEKELRRKERIALAVPEGNVQASRSALPYIWMLESRLSDRLGKPVHVAAASDGSYVVDLPLQGMTLRASFSRGRIGTNPVAAMLVSFATSFIIAWMAALRAMKKLTRPLNSLSQAAQDVARGRIPNLTSPEIRELEPVIDSFNAMARDVHDRVERRNAMLAGISHDLRSPIARMRMALELARQNRGSEHLDAMERYLGQMNAMIGEFLDFSRGVARATPERIELVSLLKELGAGIAEEHEVFLDCDANSLRRVLANLLLNARQHGGEVQPEAILTRYAAKLEIDVLDRGPGIAQGERERLFQPFERGDLARSQPGTGLGLSIVREICIARGWEIALLDRPGGGLIARLGLPSPADGNRFMNKAGRPCRRSVSFHRTDS